MQSLSKCVSGKRVYETQESAEEALVEAWTRFEVDERNGPIAVYRCDDCGRFHLTSRGPMNDRLSNAIKDGTISRHRQARHWEDKFRRK